MSKVKEKEKTDQEEGPSSNTEQDRTKFVAIVGHRKVLGAKKVNMSIRNEDLPNVISGKTLKDCVLSGSNITGTKTHDIELSKFYQEFLDIMKKWLESQLLKNDASVQLPPELIDFMTGKDGAATKEDVDQVKQQHKELSGRWQVMEELISTMGKSLQDYIHAGPTSEELGMVNRKTTDIEKTTNTLGDEIQHLQDKVQQLEEELVSAAAKLKEKDQGSSVTKTKSYKYPTGCILSMSSTLGVATHKRNWMRLSVSNDLCYDDSNGNPGWDQRIGGWIVDIPGIYNISFQTRLYLSGGGYRRAGINLLPDIESKAEGTDFYGTAVNDSNSESNAFSVRATMKLHPPVVIRPFLYIRQSGIGSIVPDETLFSVIKL